MKDFFFEITLNKYLKPVWKPLKGHCTLAKKCTFSLFCGFMFLYQHRIINEITWEIKLAEVSKLLVCMNVRVNGCLSLNTWTVIDQWAVDIVYCCLWFFVILFMDPRGEAAYIKDKCIHLHILILFHVDVVNLNLFKLHNHLKGVSNQHNIHFLI